MHVLNSEAASSFGVIIRMDVQYVPQQSPIIPVLKAGHPDVLYNFCVY